MNSTNWPVPNVWILIAQFVEHCSAHAEAMGLNPVEVPIFFINCNFLNCNYHSDNFVWIFIAQFVEHCSAHAEAMGLNPVEVPIFFINCNFLNCNYHSDNLEGKYSHESRKARFFFDRHLCMVCLSLQCVGWKKSIFAVLQGPRSSFQCAGEGWPPFLKWEGGVNLTVLCLWLFRTVRLLNLSRVIVVQSHV